MRDWEQACWFLLFVHSYVGCVALLLFDSQIVEQDMSWLSFTAAWVMIGAFGVMVVTSEYLKGRVLNGPGLIKPKYVKFCNIVGPLGMLGVIYTLDYRKGDLAGPLLYWVILTASVSSFSMLMLLRPVATDFGLFYPFCVLLFSFSVREYGRHASETIMAAAVCVILVCARATFETMAILNQAADDAPAENHEA